MMENKIIVNHYSYRFQWSGNEPYSATPREQTQGQAPAQNILSSTMRGSGKQIGGTEAIKLNMNETGVSGYFGSSSF